MFGRPETAYHLRSFLLSDFCDEIVNQVIKGRSGDDPRLQP